MTLKALSMVGGGLLVALLGTFSALAEPASTDSATASEITRGEYLVRVMGCADCHTPKGMDARPIPGMELAGHPADAPLPVWRREMFQDNILATINLSFTAFAGPFGVAVAGNLSPCPDTGIGRKTAEELIESWRTGKHWKEDRMVLPPMPMDAYQHLTDDDIRAIFAYLMSLPAVYNDCPKSQLVTMPGAAAPKT